MPDSQARVIWMQILACLAMVILACGLKNYLAVALNGTTLCPYLCPSFFETEHNYPVLGLLHETQRWILQQFQQIIELVVVDQWNLATSLVFAPVIEELLYRGPLFLTRGSLHRPTWWLLGIGLSILFAFSHGRTGLALVPLTTLGLFSLWLISTTNRFWPSIALHFLYNFFFLSLVVYQSLWISD